MKYLTLLLILAFCLATPAFAEHPVKACLAYNIDDGRSEEAVGAATNTDIFGVKGLDHDMLVVSQMGETITSDEKKIINGLSYNYEVITDWNVLVGAGLSSVKYEDKELDEEIDKYLYIGASLSF